MLTDVGAGHGEGVVLADEAHGVVAAAIPDQGNIARDIHTGGAQGHAGHRVFQAAQAAVVIDMLQIVVPEAVDTVEDQTGGVLANGTGGALLNGAGGLFDDLHMPGTGPAIQHIGQ